VKLLKCSFAHYFMSFGSKHSPTHFGIRHPSVSTFRSHFKQKQITLCQKNLQWKGWSSLQRMTRRALWDCLPRGTELLSFGQWK
jgi:hypothetical protein